MPTTSKEIHTKISNKRAEILSVKSAYKSKLDALNTRRIMLQNKNALQSFSMLVSTNKDMSGIDELEKVNNEIIKLKEERNKKINSLQSELDDLRKNYEKKSSQEKTNKKDNSKKTPRKSISRLKDKIIVNMPSQNIIIFAAASFGLIIIVIFCLIISRGVACPKDFVGLTINEATALADELGLKSYAVGETYDPDARDEQRVTFVSAVFRADGSQNYSYDKYIDDEMRLMSGEKIAFETEDITDKQEQEIDKCESNGENYRYKFDNGKVVCYAEKTQEEKKAECEAEGKWYRDGLCKSQEEWELHYKWQDAHAACKKYGSNGYAKTLDDCYVGSDYMGPVNENTTTNESNNNSGNNSEPTAQTNNTQASDDPYQIPEDEVYTAIAVCKDVLKENYNIKVRGSEYSDGYWSGRDYEWMIVFRNGSGYQIATCSYNWRTGVGVIKYLN